MLFTNYSGPHKCEGPLSFLPGKTLPDRSSKHLSTQFLKQPQREIRCLQGFATIGNHRSKLTLNLSRLIDAHFSAWIFWLLLLNDKLLQNTGVYNSNHFILLVVWGGGLGIPKGSAGLFTCGISHAAHGMMSPEASVI